VVQVPVRRLAFEERCEIKRRLGLGQSYRVMGGALGRAASTIQREVDRNGGRSGYHPWYAQGRWKAMRARPKPFKLEGNGRLARVVAARLANKWSPEQIAARLRKEHPDDPRWWVSPEAIYSSLYVQGRGGLADELRQHLRARKGRRRDGGDGRGLLVDMVSIAQRPPEADDRRVPGHWEGDLILGSDGRSALGTLVERSSRYVLLFVLRDNHTAEATRVALVRAVRTLPAELRRSLTWDQGKEMADHVRFRVDTGVEVYFCDPASPWQRGTNENTNGLLRQYFPKGTSFLDVTDTEARRVARELNGRPRKTLGWDTPAEALTALLATAA
jgi:transposase, IS30 family